MYFFSVRSNRFTRLALNVLYIVNESFADKRTFQINRDKGQSKENVKSRYQQVDKSFKNSKYKNKTQANLLQSNKANSTESNMIVGSSRNSEWKKQD